MASSTVLLSGRAFLESPRWRDDILYVADIHTGEVLAVDLDGQIEVLATIHGGVGSIGFREKTMLIAGGHDRRIFELKDRTLTPIADLSPFVRCELHDMAVDSKGRVFIGHMDYDYSAGEEPVPDTLLRVDLDGSVHRVAEDFAITNGMVVALDDQTLIVAESRENRLLAFTIHDDGSLDNRRVWAQFEAAVDGICLDAEGAVWAALPRAGTFVRVREGGEVVDTIPVSRHAIACALGGPDGRTLFMITDGTLGKRDEGLAKRTSAVETVRVKIPGVERP